MSIDVANAPSGQGVAFDEVQDLAVGCHPCQRQIGQVAQNDFALSKAAEGEFANNERMYQHLPCFEQGDESPVTGSQMVYPYRRIDEDHERARRRGGALRCR